MTAPASARDDSGLLRRALRACGPGIAFAGLMGLFVNVLHLIVPLYMIQVYDRVIGSRNLDTLTMLTLLAFGCLAFLALFDFIRAKTFMVVSEQLARRVGPAVLGAAVADTLRSQSARAANATRDIHELRQFIAMGPVSLPFDAAFTPAFLALLFLIHPAYGGVAIAGVGLLLALGLVTELFARRPSVQANDAILKSNTEIAAAIRHAEVIEAMGMLPAIVRRWQQTQARALDMIGFGNGGARSIAAISRSLRMALQIVTLATGAILVIDQQVTAGTIMASSIMLGRLLLPFEQMIEGWRQWGSAFAAVGRLRNMLRDGDETRPVMPHNAENGRLVVDRLSFVPAGADRTVLGGVAFTLDSGEMLGVVGPSGAGKSTLARLLVGVWTPTTGGVYLDGHGVTAWERASFGSQVGYLPQSPGLMDGTVRENIARFTDADPAEVIAAAKRADVHEMIGRLPQGYDTRIGADGFALSGGQRQRIALARALFGRPKLLVLDEPNANMDGAGEQSLIRTLADLRQQGVTVVVIAHRLSIMDAADKLLILKDGRVEHFGARQQVLAALAKPAAAERPKVVQLASERSARA